MSAPLTFGEFYADIRSHFSGNIWDYDKFKQCKGNRAKAEYLMGHAVVQNALAVLTSRNSQIPLCSIFGAPHLGDDQKEKSKTTFPRALVHGTPRFPQMSKKVEVKVTKKKGRMLVAKEKIEPGMYNVLKPV